MAHGFIVAPEAMERPGLIGSWDERVEYDVGPSGESIDDEEVGPLGEPNAPHRLQSRKYGPAILHLLHRHHIHRRESGQEKPERTQKTTSPQRSRSGGVWTTC